MSATGQSRYGPLRRFVALAVGLGVGLVLTGCSAHTTPASNITGNTATLSFVGSCDKGEDCSWFVRYRKVGTNTWIQTAARGPVAGPASNAPLSEKVSGLSPATQYEYQACGNAQPGRQFSCVGADGTTNATTRFATTLPPIPADAAAGPPPIQVLPAATATPPPADAIGDPVTSNAVCGDWHLQHSYGNRWPTVSSWWEYRCIDSQVQDHPPPCSGAAGACNAVCYGYPFDSYTVETDRADYFYWDDTNPAFYGQSNTYSINDHCAGYTSVSPYWWNGPTAEWYNLGPNARHPDRYR
jgi:hypothetical protein